MWLFHWSLTVTKIVKAMIRKYSFVLPSDVNENVDWQIETFVLDKRAILFTELSIEVRRVRRQVPSTFTRSFIVSNQLKLN